MQGFCWRKGLQGHLITYCNKHESCHALALYLNGFSVNNHQKLCWPSAFFKTGSSGKLDLAGQLTLAPQAVLLVKKSRWAPGNKPAQVLKVWAMGVFVNLRVQAQLLGWCWPGRPCCSVKQDVVAAPCCSQVRQGMVHMSSHAPAIVLRLMTIVSRAAVACGAPIVCSWLRRRLVLCRVYIELWCVWPGRGARVAGCSRRQGRACIGRACIGRAAALASGERQQPPTLCAVAIVWLRLHASG